MPIPSKEVIIRRLSENRLDPGCAHYPCHDVLETWFVLLRILSVRGYVPRRIYNLKKGREGVSCKECEWIHGKETVARLNGFLADAGNRGLQPQQMYLVFAESMNSTDDYQMARQTEGMTISACVIAGASSGAARRPLASGLWPR